MELLLFETYIGRDGQQSDMYFLVNLEKWICKHLYWKRFKINSAFIRYLSKPRFSERGRRCGRVPRAESEIAT